MKKQKTTLRDIAKAANVSMMSVSRALRGGAGVSGELRTRIFYCDPQASWQKGHIEKNHVLIRRILPKGTSFQKLTQEDINLITCHINSFAREIFDNKTPFELMNRPEHKKLLDVLSLHQIPHDEVCLRPRLLKR